MKIIYYTILQTEHGQAIQCGRCSLISYHPDDLAQRYCGYCKLFFNDLTDPLPPLTLADLQILYNRLYRFLAAEEEMRKLVFPQSHPKRMEKLTANAQAIADLIKLKDILKEQFKIAFPDPPDFSRGEQIAVQPRLLDVPPPKSSYQ